VQLDTQRGINQHGQQNHFMQGLERNFGVATPGSKWDGYSGDYSLILGHNFNDGRGNVTAYGTYTSQDPVFQGARDYSGCQLKSTLKCTGSVNSNQFYLASDPATLLSVQNHSFVTYPAAGANPPPLFNSNPYESLIHQDTRYTAGFLSHYDVNDFFKPYLTFQHMHDQTNTQVAPGGLFQGSGATDTGGFLVNCNNPLLSAQQQGVLGCSAGDIATGATRDIAFGRRNVEGGPRQFEYDHDNYRIVAGTKGKLELHYLPGYAPELNPDELVWNYMKRTGTARRPLGKGEVLQDNIEADMLAIQRNPGLVKSFFRAPYVAYITD